MVLHGCCCVAFVTYIYIYIHSIDYKLLYVIAWVPECLRLPSPEMGQNTLTWVTQFSILNNDIHFKFKNYSILNCWSTQMKCVVPGWYFVRVHQYEHTHTPAIDKFENVLWLWIGFITVFMFIFILFPVKPSNEKWWMNVTCSVVHPFFLVFLKCFWRNFLVSRFLPVYQFILNIILSYKCTRSHYYAIKSNLINMREKRKAKNEFPHTKKEILCVFHFRRNKSKF